MSHVTCNDETAARAQQLGRAAVRALYAEISLEPKPGLVSFSHFILWR